MQSDDLYDMMNVIDNLLPDLKTSNDMMDEKEEIRDYGGNDYNNYEAEAEE